MDIGASIKKLRIKNGLTQQQLAEYLNVSMQTVSRWETSVTCPDIMLLPLLAKRFRVTVDSLFNMGGNTMKTLQSDSLRIRAWSESDANDLFAVKQTSKNFMGYLSFDTVQDSLDSIQIWIKYQEMYPVIFRETGKLIGVVGLVDVNRYQGYREIEVHICEPYHNVDYVTEAHKLILHYGFRELGLVAAFSYCSREEEVLHASLLSTGFVYEGTLRKFGRDRSDRMRYSILKEEFLPL